MKKNLRMDSEAIAARKKVLINEGHAYRSGVANARMQVRISAQPFVLAQAAVRLAGTAALGMLGARSPLVSLGLQKFMPVLLNGVATLSKKPLGKPLLRGAAIAVAVTGLAALIFRRKK